VLSLAQMRGAGLSESGIRREVAQGRLHPLFRAVYAYGNPNVGERGKLWAATLACGPGAVVSHRSAAALVGLIDRGPVVIDVIARGSRGRKIDGIRVHRVRPLRRDEIGTFDGIPCTSPARTFVDLAATVGLRTLRSGFERAAAKRLLDLDAIEVVLARGPRRGAGLLRGLIAEWRLAAPVARRGRLKSPLEAKVLPMVLRGGAPEPRLNTPVRLASGKSIEVDFLWEAERFVVEADSRDFHATDVAFIRDRWRDRELMRVGYATLRVSHQEAESESAAVAETIRLRLGLKP
jgi:very-short-patch-repair endonuclease